MPPLPLSLPVFLSLIVVYIARIAMVQDDVVVVVVVVVIVVVVAVNGLFSLFAAGLTEGHSERNAEAGNELFAPHARKLGH